MEHLLVYLPMDRRHALVRGEELPDYSRGAALFADISGFTPLTAALVRELGPRRGAEELTQYLNRVYDALINELHRYGGSVIAFAGDAITCWFDGDDGLRATACALAMQRVMQELGEMRTPAGGTVALSMKAAVAAGAVRRFLVGDPALRVIDTLAGHTLVRLAAAEHEARRGEVILDDATLRALDDAIVVGEVRQPEGTDLRFGVVRALNHAVLPVPWPPLVLDRIVEDQVRSWLLPAIYQRLSRGLGEFLTELRPTVALFLRFDGIDYDSDPDAGKKLDAYIRWVQHVVERYEGTLVDLNIGDKGSYIYINFGAPFTHENDVERAARTALELQVPPSSLDFIQPVQIGISQGRMRAGAYGGAAHRTYGVLGDEVNMAARLMMTAQPGQTIVSEAAQRFIADAFEFERLPPTLVKGKGEPVTIFSLRGALNVRPVSTPHYLLPMVGREQELRQIEEKLEQVAQGEGQIISISGEPGVGKSRLVAEVMRHAAARGWDLYAGACGSHGVNSSYLVWQPVWRALFDLNPSQSTAEQLEAVRQKLAAISENLVRRLPLLDSVLQLSIPDNNLTRSLDAKVRKTALESLLVDILRALTEQKPTLIVLEDCHWLDPLSYDLLQLIAEAIPDRPVCLVVVHRALELERLRTGRLGALPHYTGFELQQFTADEATQLVALKLAQLTQGESAISEELLQRLVKQAQGNPFYIEELTTYLHYRGLTSDPHASPLEFELPDSLHRLVLSRLDQLSEQQKIVVKVASVIGRVFRAAWIAGVYPQLGDPKEVAAELEQVHRQELTLLDPAEPELAYFFKQVITQDVSYESIPYAMRATLHEQIGQFIEQHYSKVLDQYLDLLAFHYSRSGNAVKRREYLWRAGEAAQMNYDNLSAIEYYKLLLPLLPGTELLEVQLKLGEVLELIGKWEEAQQLYTQALEQAQAAGDGHAVARSEMAMGELLRKQAQYAEANEWLKRAQATFEALDDAVGLGQVFHIRGTVSAQQGEYEHAQALYERSLAIRQQLGDRAKVASLLSNLGILARFGDDYGTARSLYEESLAIRRDLQDPWAIANSLNNLGLVARYQNDPARARSLLTESLLISRDVGDPWATANILTSLAEVALDQRDFEAATRFLAESLTINRRLGDRRAIAFLLETFSILAAAQALWERALFLAQVAATLRDSIQAPLSPAEQERLEQTLASAWDALDEGLAHAAHQRARDSRLEQVLDALLDNNSG